MPIIAARTVQRPTRHRHTFVAMALAALSVTGCITDAEPPAPINLQLPAGYAYAPAAGAQPQMPAAVPAWWETYGSDELNGLIRTALQNNYNLKAAVARIEQANLVAGIEGSYRWPELNGTMGASLDAPDRDVGSLSPGQRPTAEHLYEVGVEASYEIDLWGKNRSRSEAALARAEASVFDREVVALTLVADMAQNYVEYLSLQERVANAELTLANLQKMSTAVERRMQGGVASRIELNQQQTTVAIAESVLPQLMLLRDQKLHAMAVLAGQAPSDLSIRTRTLDGLAFPDTRPGVPADLIVQRPDIRSVEAQLRAADADINVARAALFPSINLDANAGYGARHLQYLLSPQSLVFGAGAAITQSIFDAGRRQSQVKLESARRLELTHAYIQAVYQGIGEVEDALAAIDYLSKRRAAQSRSVEIAGLAFKLSEQSFSMGVIDYLTLLNTERTLFEQRDELLKTKFERYTASIDLFRAIGGSISRPSTEQAARPRASDPR